MKLETQKTADLHGAALDWAVAIAVGMEVVWSARDEAFKVFGQCEGSRVFIGYIHLEDPDDCEDYSPSTDWAFGGLLLSKYKVGLLPPEQSVTGAWQAHCVDAQCGEFSHADSALVALCRCIVAEGLGYEVSVPVRLLP